MYRISPFIPGICEETGRLFGYKRFLKDKADRNDAILLGVGHAVMEGLLAMVQTGVCYLCYGYLLNAGSFQSFIDQVNAAGNTMLAKNLTAMPDMITSFSMTTALLLLAERPFLIFMHVLLSIIVSKTVVTGNKKYYILAILIHTFIDIPVGFTIAGIIPQFVSIFWCIIVGTEALVILIYQNIKINQNQESTYKGDN